MGGGEPYRRSLSLLVSTRLAVPVGVQPVGVRGVRIVLGLGLGLWAKSAQSRSSWARAYAGASNEQIPTTRQTPRPPTASILAPLSRTTGASYAAPARDATLRRLMCN